jgi:hypothetical protein
MNPFPIGTVALAATLKSSPPVPLDLGSKTSQRMKVGRHREVREVPSNDATQPPSLHGNRQMPTQLQLSFHVAKLRLQSLPLRAPNQQKALYPGARTDVRETQEVEGLSFLSDATASRQGGQPPKSQQSRLLRVQFQGELCESLAQFAPKPFGITPVLEARNQIVSVAHEDHVPECTPISPASSPKVEDVVQVDVRQ